MTEWRPVVGHEGRYEVSSCGQVRSLPRPGVPKARVLRQWTQYGYPSVNLSCGSRDQRENRPVHVLVAAAWLGPRPDGLVIRHLDGNSRNNDVRNLAYGTPAENVRDTVRHGTHPEASKTHCYRGHEFTEDNTYHYTYVRNGESLYPTRFCRKCKAENQQRYDAARHMGVGA